MIDVTSRCRHRGIAGNRGGHHGGERLGREADAGFKRTTIPSDPDKVFADLSHRKSEEPDNYQTHKTPTVKAWLEKHPRFHMHFTPTYSSWIDQVERFFGFVTDDLLRRGDHRSVQALVADIRNWVKAWNENPPHSSGPKPPNKSWNP